MRARKCWAAVFAALVMTAVQAANLSVTDVKIAQRYPWNGLVDITYTVNCDDPNKDVWVYPVGYDADTATSVALMPQYLSGAGASNAVHNGTHRMTWDMAKQMGKDYNRAAFSVTLHAYCDAAPYMVIDLSKGPTAEEYDISYLAEIPKGGWNDDYKTTKMVFRLILPGETGNGATLTQPYYFGVFPITEQQWCLIAGGTSSANGWKSGVSYNNLRGSVLGSKWPEHQQVDATSFIGMMRLRTGITIDLPTNSQWYRAASAGGQHADIVNPNAWGICGLGDIGEWNLNNRVSGQDYYGYVSGRAYPAADSDVWPPRPLPYGWLGTVSGGSGWDENRSRRVTLSIELGSISVTYGGRPNNRATEKIGARLVALPTCK